MAIHNLSEAQDELSKAYIGGSFGVLVSGIIWAASALALYVAGFEIGSLVFFFGGMLIHPVSTFLSKRMNQGFVTSENNPLPRLAMELTVILFVGLFLAFWLSKDNPANFFAIMLLIVGARYMPFATLYSQKIYWVLGGVLMAFGLMTFLYLTLPAYIVAGLGGLIEITFAFVLLKSHAR